MFFRKLFKKDYRYYLEKGDKHFTKGEFAEARLCYGESVEALQGGDPTTVAHLKGKIASADDELALLNMKEADSFLRMNNQDKAREYLELALELAEGGAVREKAENLMRGLTFEHEPVPESKISASHHSCTGCSSAHSTHSDNNSDSGAYLGLQEQFHLLVHTLPETLAERYATMGEKFAYAYVQAHNENFSEALTGYEELLSQDPDDILLYETALIHFRLGNRQECERRLNLALSIKPDNPLCHLSFVQLCIDTERYDEAVDRLKAMQTLDILADQSLLMLGEVYQIQGKETEAVDVYSRALENPSLKKAAAERLVPILDAQGRSAEATYLIKTHLKGCC